MKNFVRNGQAHSLRPEVSALIELGVLFLPGIPALIWLWPDLDGSAHDVAQSLVYVYILAGTLFVGLRRWSWDELGVNRRGIVLSLICGAIFIAEPLLGYTAIGFPFTLRPFAAGRLAWEIFFYFGLVGVVEELLYRGLLFRLLENWRGTRIAILGSALGFAIWHIGRPGLHIAGLFLIGLLFGLIRWRAGGIVGLIIVHGFYDLILTEVQTPLTIETVGQFGQISIANPLAAVIGDGLILVMLLYLWKLHPYFQRSGSL